MPTAISTKAAARKVKASAPKALTVTKATAEAGRIARRTMPGVLVTVDSRGSWDMATDTQTVITMVTFPETADASDLACWADSLPDVIASTWTAVAITITRRVN